MNITPEIRNIAPDIVRIIMGFESKRMCKSMNTNISQLKSMAVEWGNSSHFADNFFPKSASLFAYWAII